MVPTASMEAAEATARENRPGETASLETWAVAISAQVGFLKTQFQCLGNGSLSTCPLLSEASQLLPALCFLPHCYDFGYHTDDT